MDCDHEIAAAAVSDIAVAFGADGYDASIVRDPKGRLRFVVTAGVDACADCLVPKSVLRELLRTALTDTPLEAESIDIEYPEDSGG